MSGTPTRSGYEGTRAVGGTSDADALILAEPGGTGGCPCQREAHDGTATTAGNWGFLRVAFTDVGRRPPREWVRAARGGPPVHVVDATPGAAGPPVGGPGARADGDDEVVTVEAAGPSNLTDLGVRFTEALDRLEALDAHDAPDAVDSGDDTGGRPDKESERLVCCLGSLTVLLQYVDRKPAYRFLNAATNEVAARGGTSHAHVTSEALDERTVDTFASLFDVVVEPSVEGHGFDVVCGRRR